MIRPFTIVCFVAFAGAGAWLYQVKHHVATYDRELRDMRRQTEQMRDRISILRAEWALLNEPDRLRQVATRHLPLEPMQPTQFARAAEMERRLPQAVAFAGTPNLFAPPEALRQAGNVMVAAAQVPQPATAQGLSPAAAAAPAARPQPVSTAAPVPSRPAPAADPRAPEAPALQALAATVAAQRATLTAVPPPVPPRPAPLRDVAPRAPSPTLAQLTPGVIRQAAAAPAPISPASAPVAQPRPAAPVQAAPVQAEPARVARAAPPPAPAPAAAPAPPTFVSALGGGSSLGRPALAPPVPFGSASAATLGGLAPPQPR